MLRTPLQLTAIDFERALFKRAEMAHNSQIQSDVYAQLRVLRDHAEQLPDIFLDALAGQLAAFKDPPKPSAEAHSAAFKSMTLVEDTDIDRDIVLHEMARREAFRVTSPLLLLGQRFAVLAAQPAFDPERLPLGPYALCRALRDCGEQMQLNLDAQLVLYQVFDRMVLARHAELVDRLNILLEREGVLPGLVYRPPAPPLRATWSRCRCRYACRRQRRCKPCRRSSAADQLARPGAGRVVEQHLPSTTGQ